MENIRVALRMRPINQREIDGKEELSWNISGGDNIALLEKYQQELVAKKKISGSTKLSYTFDACFSDQDDNWLVYEKVVRPVATSSLEGINGTIFMYGQTGCGKTFTMMGMRQLTDGSKNLMPKALNDDSDDSDSSGNSDHQKGGKNMDKSTQGILISSLKEIFKEAGEDDSKKYFFRCSYIEIYNDNVHDLLQRNKIKMQEPLKIVEDAQKGEFIIQGLLEENVTNLNEVLDILKQGELNRHFAATAMNHNSSRSHTIFRLMLRSVENKLITSSTAAKSRRRASVNLQQIDLSKLNIDTIKTTEEFKIGTDSIVADSVLNFVDLAGSEKASIHSEDNRQKEGQHINRSLFFLTQVISMKADKKNDAHIPYRNSPLTKILKTSLGGNSRTLVILALTPAYSQYENSMSTLRFGVSAKKIQNKVSANLTLKADDEAVKLVIAEYEKKIKDLQEQLAEERKKNSHMTSQIAYFENDEGGDDEREARSLKKKKQKAKFQQNQNDDDNEIDDQLSEQELEVQSPQQSNNSPGKEIQSNSDLEAQKDSDQEDKQDQSPVRPEQHDKNNDNYEIIPQNIVVIQDTKVQLLYGEDIFSAQPLPLHNLGRVKMNDIKNQVEREAKIMMEVQQPSHVSHTQQPSHVSHMPHDRPSILKNSNYNILLNDPLQFEANKHKMYEYKGIFTTLSEIDQDKKTTVIHSYVQQYLRDLFKTSTNSVKFVDKNEKERTDFEIMNQEVVTEAKSQTEINSNLRRTTHFHDVIHEDKEEQQENQQHSKIDELRRKAEYKAKSITSESQFGKNLSPGRQFINKLREKSEEIILSRKSSYDGDEDSYNDVTIKQGLDYHEEILPIETKKQQLNPYQINRSNNQNQMTQQILAQSQKLIESIQFGAQKNKQIAPVTPTNVKHTESIISQNISLNNSPVKNQDSNNQSNPIMDSIYQNIQYFNQSASSQKKPQSRKMEVAPQQNQNQTLSFQNQSYLIKPQEEPQNIIYFADGYQIPNRYSPPRYGKKQIQKF